MEMTMRYVRPNVRLFEALEVPEAVEVIRKYAPEVAETPADNWYANQTLFRIFKDDYPEIMDQVLEELEQISY